MDTIMRCLALSLMAGMSCGLFFGTLLPQKQRSKLPAFLAFSGVFLVMAFTEAPGYFLQPIRVIVFLGIVIRIFFQTGIRKTVFLSMSWCALYWVLNLLAVSVVYALPWRDGRIRISEWLGVGMLLVLSLLFRCKYRNLAERFDAAGWGRFVWLAGLSLLVTITITISVWHGDSRGKGDVLWIAVGYTVINVLVVLFVGTLLEKEAEVRKIHFMQERLQNQMELYENMQENDRQRRRCLHDYKNQLGCIQGMLEAGRMEEALAYIEELNGSIRKGEDCVNTNHLVVNTVLNQKYLYAQELGITMVIAVNDLSALRMDREEIVTLLVNLLDNAVEACEKLEENKVIQFKMMLEDGELTISVRNPVKEPVVIKGKIIGTTKGEKDRHGIGFLNINSVIEKNHGVSVLECRDGWFYFSAVIPGV